MVRTILALLGLLVAIVLGAPAPASGASDGSVTFGTQWWDQTAREAKFQEFSEEPRGAFLEQYALRAWRDRNLVLFYGDHSLRHDQSNSLTWWNGAKLRVDLGYQEIPHNLSLVAHSPFSEVSPGRELVPDSLQAANQANPAGYVARLRDALAVSPRLNLGFRTDITRARLRARPARDWQFELKGSRRMRSGRKAYGGGFSPGNGVEIWEPIAQRILDGEARATYQKERATLIATAGVSEFHNEVNSLTFDNPARLTGAQNQGRIDLYPNNRSVRGTVGVAYRLPMRTAFNGTIGVSRNTQNDPWLPFTVNAADPYSSLDSLPPERSTHAKVDVFTQDYRLTSHPRKDFGGTLTFRQYHYLNRTPVHVFSGESVADGAFTVGALETEAFGYRHQSYGAEVNYNPLKQVSIIGTADRLDRTRTVREVHSDREEAVGGKLRLRPMSKISLEAHVRHAKRWARDADFSYDGEEQTALRRFDVADRKQMQAGGTVTIVPIERLELGGSFGYLFEKYSDDLADTSRIGLRRIHQRNASGDVTYHANPNLDLTAAVGWEQMVSRQASRQSRTAAFGTADSTWTARLKDEGWFGNLGIEWRAKPDLLGFSALLDYARWPGTFVFATVSPSTITAQNPPGIRYRRIDLTLESDYNLADRTQLGLRYIWEEFDAVDFSAVDIPQLGIAAGASNVNYIYLGDSFQSYRAHRVALLVRQTF
jgi:MtrB/PioB family decaheme-associated outer membrane protein